MKRANLISLLHAYQPTKAEYIYKKDMLNFINLYEDCFERSLLIGHITASAFLLNKAKDKALLMHHKKLNMWVQPGGHCDGNPDVLTVALKEAQEESGIVPIEPLSTAIFDIDIHHIPAHKNVPAHYHYDVRFLLRVITDQSAIHNEESHALAWFDCDAPLPTQEPSILRMFKKWQMMMHSNSKL